MKAFFAIILVCLSFSMAHAADIDLNIGESISIDNDTITCGQNNGKCSYIAGNVYCGNSCEYIAGNVYCSSQSNGKCSYIAGNVYCGNGCEYIAGNVHCVSGGLAKPARPSKN